MRQDTKDIIKLSLGLIAVACAAGGFLWVLLAADSDCKARGGALVRGVFGYACVKGADKP